MSKVLICLVLTKHAKDGGYDMASVLIVDDAAFMRMTIKQMLEANGHSMAGEAGDGNEAIFKYKELNPDAVILDITMPNMNGIEALKLIKAYDPKARVVICSAMGQQAMLAEAIQYGAKDFIVKPFEAKRLIAALEKVMGE